MYARIRKTVAAVVLAALLVTVIAAPTLVSAATPDPAPVSGVHADSLVDVAAVALANARTFAAIEAEKAAEAERARLAAAAAEAERVRAAAAAAKAKRARATTASEQSSSRNGSAAPAGDQLAQAQSILAGLKDKYPRYLGGASVSIGETPGGYQAVCYYSTGRIVIDPNHRASLGSILAHEAWHIIDWNDNGRIDWRESVPPSNAGDYRG